MNNPMNVIVRFELKEGEIEVLVPLIQEFFEKEVSAVPGFISAKIHKNEEGSVLINYATWESEEKFLKFVKEVAQVSEISKKIQAFASKTDRVFEITL
ncbi:antibiotic biosynthesis monooxygenase [Dyadobacter sp. NIV53]|uniref:antibiotic biosynthesis monooxygenase family protein n=1 Tax=Dyadobacter sp. NIV53 TaxID=2861765 RepID=UPI001C888ED2|nr:antibiotic biosynthesis monooxygenase [Dyadobacter sp. NIV53]